MLHTLKVTQLLKSDIQTVWDFMSSPANLELITPPGLDLRILSARDTISDMHAGQIIEYSVRPFPTLKMHWVTEITHVVPLQYFVDEQRYGPYAFWHHQHSFKEVPGGTEMTDLLHYRIPFGWIGRLLNSLLIKRQVKNIFDSRFKELEVLFNDGK
ncbi:MAG: SRPBCC family protein [Bacteroidota bacterium]